MVFSLLLMAALSMVSGSRIERMVSADLSMQMETATKANGERTRSMGKALRHGQTAHDMKESLLLVENTDMVSIRQALASAMTENLDLTRWRALELILLQMAACIQAI